MSKMKRETSVVFTIKGDAYQFDVSKFTTCDDVIKMAKKYVTSLEEKNKYAIYESTSGVLKLLPGNTKILRRIRSWGTSCHNITLEIRPVEMKSKMTMISRAKKTIQRLRTLMKKHELKTDRNRKLEEYIDDNIDSIVFNKDKQYAKNITVIYRLNEAENQDRSKLSYDVNLPIRTAGDGNENISCVSEEKVPGVGGQSDDNFNATDDSCTLNCGFISGDSEHEYLCYKKKLNELTTHENDTCKSVFDDNNSCAIISELETNVIDHSDENNALNINDYVIDEDDDISLDDDESAFEDDSECESIFENNELNLNDCVIHEYDDIPSADDESAFEDDSDCESIFENNELNLNDCIIHEDDDIPSADDETDFEDDSDCESIFELERNVLEDNTTLKLN